MPPRITTTDILIRVIDNNQDLQEGAFVLIQSAIEDVGWNKVAQHYINKTREIDRQCREQTTS